MSTVSDRAKAGQNTATPSGRHLPTDDMSHLAVRDDGAWLVSLEDAGDRDLSGREVVMFVVMTDEERDRARETIEDATACAAAQAINRLPALKKPGSEDSDDEGWEDES